MYKKKLTLDQPAVYQIKVPGVLDEHWSDWDGKMSIMVKSLVDGSSVTILTGAIDQAALLGLMRKLYYLGLPLISVICLEFNFVDGD